MKEKARYALIAELILGVIFYLFLYLHPVLRHQLWVQHNEVFLLIFFSPLLVLMLLLVLWQKKPPKVNTFNRWLMIIFWPLLSLGGLIELMNVVAKAWPHMGAIVAVILLLIGLGWLIPFAIAVGAEVKWTVPRLILIFWMMENLMEICTLGHIPGNKFFNTVLSTGLWAAFAYTIWACFLAWGWGYNFDFNLKFEKSANFSDGVLVFLIVFGIVDIIWNAFGGYGNNLFSVLFSYHTDSMKFTLNSFSQAAEAGIMEEMNRYLVIIVLLYALRKNKWQVPITIFISALFFGLLHFANFGWQKLAPTIAQVTSAFAIGLFFAAFYLYTGKLWLTMLMHFFVDFLIFLQENGDQPGTWNGSTGEWLVAIISVVVPVCIYLWMISGKRILVMQENSDRILQPLEQENMY
ncbi:CPBP family intramembrane glutamic endopeptidase [Lactobacillus paragasseri]|uniref:CPBP family intramembrane glutamic endopeptidase n=1 Tax=Lactobacillus paragasseri TaxID=2107999 RepID=UPI0012E2AF0D|nr:CPBP family intramembrane glutamic endopeptidase [Lactobacillus paragasseri]MDK8086723.1 CPBP family intramembrane metalloprotease [Lactobacillus paragasseri]MDX5118743.1 CPBP family intramembrane glutamic endopeptidase [Lactobacillus paragasseri]MDX5122536.1 CPBP family intramembrane glutamic endopeptidase [Lactobacillus paragasseri]QGT98445.1 CPBP family intramembrane metalloprotease [Lactobacillus paragasseri]UWI47863.1 CPBP family intramembrane metalloprotease [Lactobacillus paragasseri